MISNHNSLLKKKMNAFSFFIPFMNTGPIELSQNQISILNPDTDTIYS